MSNLDNIPLGEWPAEAQREFKIATLVDGKDWEFRPVQGWNWHSGASSRPALIATAFYRLAPLPAEERADALLDKSGR